MRKHSKTLFGSAILAVATCIIIGLAFNACSVPQQTPVQGSPSQQVKQTESPESASPTETPVAGLPETVWLGLNLLDDESSFEVTDNDMKKTVMDAVMNMMLSSTALPGEKPYILNERIRIAIKYNKQDTEDSIYYAYPKDGKYFMQSGKDTMCTPIREELYKPLLDLAMDHRYHLPHALTVKSGNNEIHAMGHAIWSVRKKDGLNADMLYYMPQQMADYVQYLTLDPGPNDLVPFTPYADGKETYGGYRLFDENFTEIPVLQPSGLEPQTYLLKGAKPGKYIVEFQTTIETDEYRYGYQYFFGVIVPEEGK